ncbi:hypothetical protein [Natronococcus wangiae]|uniref:hypothetical protein n=1 Tax=Natronococcus wangiae TaxID=3068275 RepID=UPI00273FC7A4|nr:hypothetical protein [Natronococcus sp. AD5]
MVVNRALEELQIEGEFDEHTPDEYPTIVTLMRDVLDHGEVHATWADSDDKVEVRQGTATFDFDGEVIVIDDGITEHYFAMDQLVNWEKPVNVYESEA